MNYSFKLKNPDPNKNPKKDKASLILFNVYFKNEGKTFSYSTGEVILPKDWDFENRRPKDLNGRKADAQRRRTINKQLSRYSNLFQEIDARYQELGEELNIKTVREKFNIEFKKTNDKTTDFLKVYDLFLENKKDNSTDTANSNSTIKRYIYNKTLLIDYSEKTKYKLNFNTIDDVFYNKFIAFCVQEREHSTNTLSRNIGLFKTFMFWALENKYTYNDKFKGFKNIKRFETDEVALSIEQVKYIYEFNLTNNKKLEKVRDLFIFGCFTGMRFSNYSDIKKQDIVNDFIRVFDKKDKYKPLSIPMNKYSKNLLEKYDYNLPKISNQKFNEYLKDLFKLMEFNTMIKKTMKYGENIIETESPLYARISSHTARRSFITIMINKGISHQAIMRYTGHKSLETFITYYRPNEKDLTKIMNYVFE